MMEPQRVSSGELNLNLSTTPITKKPSIDKTITSSPHTEKILASTLIPPLLSATPPLPKTNSLPTPRKLNMDIRPPISATFAAPVVDSSRDFPKQSQTTAIQPNTLADISHKTRNTPDSTKINDKTEMNEDEGDAIRNTSGITPTQLIQGLKPLLLSVPPSLTQPPKQPQGSTFSLETYPVILDMRPADTFLKSHIVRSINISVPPIWFKRLQRGSHSQFSLENFVANGDEGVEELQTNEKRDVVLMDGTMDSGEIKGNSSWALFDALPRTSGMFSNETRFWWVRGGYDAVLNEIQNSDSKVDYSCLLSQISVEEINSSGNNGESENPQIKLDSSSDHQKDTKASSKPKLGKIKPKMSPLKLHNLEQSGKDGESPLTAVITAPVGPNLQAAQRLSLLNTNFASLKIRASSPDTHPSPEFQIDITEVLPNLYLGNDPSNIQQPVEFFRSLNVKNILNTARECEDNWGRPSDIHYKKCNLQDHTEENIEHVLQDAVEFVDECLKRDECIYVHCRAGQSRSVTVVLAYLVEKRHMKLNDAYNFVKERRPAISPNIGFMTVLMKLEASLSRMT